MAELSLRHIDKIYDNNVQAVFDFNLEIKDKEFIVFVGPSGCGKSTTLRMIAGLEDISAGEFYIDGKLMNDVEPKDRDIAMVFQSYALYPHMSVYDNMAFGLKLKKVPKEEIDKRCLLYTSIQRLNIYAVAQCVAGIVHHEEHRVFHLGHWRDGNIVPCQFHYTRYICLLALRYSGY